MSARFRLDVRRACQKWQLANNLFADDGFYAMQFSLGCLRSVEDGSRFPFARNGENEKMCAEWATKWSEI